jgi:hypothetical protein
MREPGCGARGRRNYRREPVAIRQPPPSKVSEQFVRRPWTVAEANRETQTAYIRHAFKSARLFISQVVTGSAAPTAPSREGASPAASPSGPVTGHLDARRLGTTAVEDPSTRTPPLKRVGCPVRDLPFTRPIARRCRRAAPRRPTDVPELLAHLRAYWRKAEQVSATGQPHNTIGQAR